MKNNKNYTDIDGVLFNKNKTEIIQYPVGNKNAAYTIPDSVTKICDRAFYACKNLTSVTIPDSVTEIGKAAFYFCKSLESVTLPDSVTSIEKYAFSDCKSLKSITILNPDCEIYNNEYDDGSYTISSVHGEYGTGYYNGVIRGYENSTAQAYAKKFNYTFESLGDHSYSTMT